MPDAVLSLVAVALAVGTGYGMGRHDARGRQLSAESERLETRVKTLRDSLESRSEEER